jgi:hypothetical protein
MKILHDNMRALEQAVFRNKWFALASVALLLMSSLGAAAVFGKSNNGTSCYLDAERALFGGHFSRVLAHEISPDKIMQARTYYSVCLLSKGIDVRSAPTFEELFPFTAQVLLGGDGDMNDMFEAVE